MNEAPSEGNHDEVPPPAKGPTRPTKGRIRRKLRILQLVVGVILLLVAAIGIGYPLYWNHRSSIGSQTILKKQIQNIKRVLNSPSGSTCAAKPGPGILDIPKLGLFASVVQGIDPVTLETSIGHDPSTPWPSKTGTGLLAAHDVSFFSQIDNLQIGDEIKYVVPCGVMVFTVTGHQVTHPGAIFKFGAVGGVVLDTCWPTTALFYTPTRYIVTAKYLKTVPVSTENLKQPTESTVAIPNLLVPAPPALVQQGITLSTNSQMMGTMSFSGSPSSTFIQSPATLSFEASGLNLWFAMLHSLSQGRSDWLKLLGPNVSFPAQLMGQKLYSTTPLFVNEIVKTTTPIGISLTTTLNGKYPVVVHEGVEGNRIVITGLSVS